MQLTTVLSIVTACAGTAIAAIPGIEPMYYRLGTMHKRDPEAHAPGDNDPPNGWSNLDKTSGCEHKCCGSMNGNQCTKWITLPHHLANILTVAK
ncbi:hypothetical protein HII31_13127, partial [Pseudocercospora fuligena]